jgi:hypothetical protein
MFHFCFVDLSLHQVVLLELVDRNALVLCARWKKSRRTRECRLRTRTDGIELYKKKEVFFFSSFSLSTWGLEKELRWKKEKKKKKGKRKKRKKKTVAVRNNKTNKEGNLKNEDLASFTKSNDFKHFSLLFLQNRFRQSTRLPQF